ncbi:coiled-coil domain-containing protein 78 [Centrocercus urophasianus]|uniref:coiled-coil domain-containing protein 78 n=1 Tax=Centrocercus urophasianus TaxID=9002 RepID=UPI001C644EDC|nr:coiled-coil domain-containing protein 78 [Centrocercus urophasianus]
MDFGRVADKENVNALTEQAQHLANKNVQLQDRNERLHAGFGDVQERMMRLAGSKPDLSPRTVFSEEEKLKISKELVDLQIETNKMKEQYETEKFELKNMILALESRVLELELRSEKVSEERDALRDHLLTLETSRRELAEEYIILKSNYLVLGKELDQEVLKNEELSLELLSLTNARSTDSNHHHSRALATEPTAEPGRVTMHRAPAQKVKSEDEAAPEHEWQNLGRNLLGNQDHIKEEIEKLKQTYDSQQQKLEEKVIAMGKELQKAKKAVHDPQQKLAEQSAVLLASQSQLQEVEAENSQLQLKLKELSEEYRCRLTQYIRDVAEYVDGKPSTRGGPSKAPAEHADMKRFVDNMLKDIRASYKAREEQLAGAARSYKKRMKNLAKKHENLLIAYSVQREKIRSLGSSEMDSGPAELHFAITDPELLTNTTQELNRLRESKAKLELQLHELQKKRLKETSGFQLSPDQKQDEEGWAEVRKQLQEFTHTTQEDLEKERSQLLTRAIVAEEQVLELQDYIEKHLARYRQEVLWVRKLAGGEEPRARSAGAADAHSLPRSRRAISREL